MLLFTKVMEMKLSQPSGSVQWTEERVACISKAEGSTHTSCHALRMTYIGTCDWKEKR